MKLKDIIGSVASKFAAFALATVTIGSAWAEEINVIDVPELTVTTLDPTDDSLDWRGRLTPINVALHYELSADVLAAHQEEFAAIANWKIDWVLTSSEKLTLVNPRTSMPSGMTMEEADASLEGGCIAGKITENAEWVYGPLNSEGVFELVANTGYRVLGQVVYEGMSMEAANFVENEGFGCSLYLTTAYRMAHPNVVITLQPYLYHPSDSSVRYSLGEAKRFTFGLPDAPKAVVTKNAAYNKEVNLVNVNDILSGGYQYGTVTPNVAYTFEAKDTTDEASSGAYSNWKCDYIVSMDADTDAYSIGLFGQYGWGAVAFPSPVDAKAGQKIPLLMSVTKNGWNYSDIVRMVRSFTCGAINFSEENIGKTITVSLVMWNEDNPVYKSYENPYVVEEIKYKFETVTPLFASVSQGAPAVPVVYRKNTADENGFSVDKDGYPVTDDNGNLVVKSFAAGEPHFAMVADNSIAKTSDSSYSTADEAVATVEDNKEITVNVSTSIGSEAAPAGSTVTTTTGTAVTAGTGSTAETTVTPKTVTITSGTGSEQTGKTVEAYVVSQGSGDNKKFSVVTDVSKDETIVSTGKTVVSDFVKPAAVIANAVASENLDADKVSSMVLSLAKTEAESSEPGLDTALVTAIGAADKAFEIHPVATITTTTEEGTTATTSYAVANSELAEDASFTFTLDFGVENAGKFVTLTHYASDGVIKQHNGKDSWTESLDANGIATVTLTEFSYLLGTVSEEPPVAKVTIGGVTTNYSDLHEALEAGKASGTTITLLTDVDLSGVNWVPVGTSASPFTGVFDGNGKTISNLSVNDEALTYAGLLGYVTGSTFKNITISNVTVNAAASIGSLMGYCNTSSVTNCHVQGRIQLSGHYKMGGILGEGYTNFTDCSVIGDGESTSSILATPLMKTDDPTKYEYEADNIGGMVGHWSEGAEAIKNCTVKDISVTGYRKIGGMVAISFCSQKIEDVTVENVKVTCTAPKAYAEDNTSTTGMGGIVGQYHRQGGEYTGGWMKGATVKNVNLEATDSEALGIIKAGLVSSGLRDTADAESPIVKASMTFSDIAFEGVNSIPEGVKTLNDASFGPVAVAQIGTTKYETVEAALTDAQVSGATIEILADSIETPDHALEVLMGGNITLTAAAPVRVEIAPTAKTSSVDKDGMAYIRSASADVRRTFTIGENVTLVFPATAAGAGAMYVGYSAANAADMVINGRLELYEPYVGSLSTLTVNPSGSIKSISECLIVRWGATVDIIGTGAAWSDANPQAEFAYASLQGGVTTLKDTYAKGGAWVQTWNRNADKADQYGATTLALDNSVLATSKIDNQVVIAMDCDSQIVTPVVQNTGSINIDATGITAPFKAIDYTGSGTMALADYGTVNVTAGEAYVEENDLWVKKLPVAQIGETKYETIAAAVAAASTGDTIQLIADADEDVSLATWKNNAITFDLGGHTLTGQIIAPYGAKTEGIVIRNGNIVGRDSSRFYCLQFGYGSGNATLENLSVTQTSKNYRSFAVYFQQTDKRVTMRNVTLDGRFYTANSGSTIAIESGVYKNSTGLSNADISNGGVVAAIGGTFYYNPTTPNNLVAKGYIATETTDDDDVQCWVVELGPAFAKVTLKDGTETEFWDLDEAIGALAEGATLTIKPDTYTLASANYTLPKDVKIIGVEENGARVKITSCPTFNSANGLTIENVDFDGGYSWQPSAVTVHGDATFKNCTIACKQNAVYYSTVNGKLTFDGCTITAGVYALNIGEGTGDVIVKDCTISGWTSFGNVGKTIITGTTFEEGDYNYLRFYQDAVIDDCSFNNDMSININATGKKLVVSDSAFENGSSVASAIGQGEDDDPPVDNYIAVGTRITTDEDGFVTGGVFDKIDDGIIATGYISVDNLDGETKEKYPLTVGGPYEAIVLDENGALKQGYATLAEAIAAANDGDTVKMLADTEIESGISVAKDITLDLNGKTIAYTSSEKTYVFTVTDGEMIVTDTAENGKIAASDSGRAFLLNGGSLSVEAGTVSAAGFAIRNDGEGTVAIKGGTVVVAGGSAIYNNGIGVVEISGGEVSANNYAVNNRAAGSVAISGGKVSASSTQAVLNKGAGSVEISGGEITASSLAVLNFGNGTVNVRGGEISAVEDTVYNGEYGTPMTNPPTTGVVNILGGNITATHNRAIAVHTGAVNISGGEMSALNVVIENFSPGGTLIVGGDATITAPSGTGYAIHSGDGGPDITEITGGRISGSIILQSGTYSITGGIFSDSPTKGVAEGYSVDDNPDTATKDDYPYTVVSLYEAQIVREGVVQQKGTLAAMIAAAEDGDTVQLLKDVDLGTTGLVIAADKNFTLDIGEYDITGTVNGKLITNNGTVVVNGTAGCIYNQDISAQGHDAFLNNGTATINGGWFGDSDNDKTNANAINRGAGFRNFGTATINGGHFTACDNYTNGGYAYAIINGNDSNNPTLTINNADVYGKNNGNIANNSGSVTVKDGTFDVSGSQSYYSVYSYSGNTVVEGGTFTKSGNNNSQFCVEVDDDNASNPGSIAVSGGNFTKAVPEEFCADGYIPAEQDSETGMYTVKTGSYVAQNTTTGVKYETLQAAIDEATAGDTVTLLKDIDLGSGYVAIDKALTLDGDFTVKSSAAQAVLLTGSGDVTIKCDIKATAGHGIQAGTDSAAYSGKLTVDGSTVTVAKRGIRVYEEDTGFGIVVNGSTIQSNVADPTTTYTTGDDAMALSLGTTDGKGYSVELSNTVLQGFSYCINSVMSGSNLTVVMNGGKTYGRAALNVWGSNNTFTLDGVEVHGLNNQTGPTEAFACIVENKGATNNTYNINGCTFNAELSSAAASASGSSATEQMIDLRGTQATVKITGETTYTAKIGGETVAPTDEAYGRFGLIYSANSVSVPSGNSIDLDSSASASLAGVLTVLPKDVDTDDSEVFPQGTRLGYIPEVHYYWATASGFEGGYYDFNDPFDKGWLANGEFIDLNKATEMDKDVSTTVSFTLNLKGYTLTAGSYKIRLGANSVVTSDTPNLESIFAAPDATYFIAAESETTGEQGAEVTVYTYRVMRVLSIVDAANGAAVLSTDLPSGYSLKRSVNGGDWSEVQSTEIASGDLPGSGATKTYEFKAVKGASEIAIANTVGILHVADSQTNKTTIIGVPWFALGEKITVDSLVYLGNRDEGDKISAYDASADRYRTWELSGGKWTPVTNVSTTTGGDPEDAGDADKFELVRGQGLFLERVNPEKPIYLVGRVAEDGDTTPATTLPVGTTAKPTWTLIAAPSTSDLDLNTANPVANPGSDTIVVTTTGAGINVPYTYANGKWGCPKSVQKTRGKITYWATERNENAKVPAGTGFWYLNTGSEKSAQWK